MNYNGFDSLAPDNLERLRHLARQGKTVAEIVADIRLHLDARSGFTLVVLRCFIEAFTLTLREARMLEDAPCMGNEAISDDELDEALRPIILERLSNR